MDNLAREAMLAKEAGVSYGQWKALQKPKQVLRKIPEGWIACEHCGKYFKPRANQRFCDIGCRAEAYSK
jgi:hypothetical protein